MVGSNNDGREGVTHPHDGLELRRGLIGSVRRWLLADRRSGLARRTRDGGQRSGGHAFTLLDKKRPPGVQLQDFLDQSADRCGRRCGRDGMGARLVVLAHWAPKGWLGLTGGW
ncbi:hypothetical protein A9G00_10235 [Achromobacter xylosoxidans]|nr:hypothetical protein A9G00_10235 [Achromobacter xylosoxidans]